MGIFIKQFIIYLTILTLLQSCSSMYIPAVRSIPLLENKGEFLGEAGASTNSVYVNGSYAFSDKVAASVNGNLSYRNFTDFYDVFTRKDDNGGRYFSPSERRGHFAHRYGEVSVGKINMLPRSGSRKLELFGGFGMGNATDYGDRYHADYSSIFGQMNYGIKKRVVEAGASLRFASTNLNY